jgi:hypothetical protein
MPPKLVMAGRQRKSRAKPKSLSDTSASHPASVATIKLDLIQWAKHPEWTDDLVGYLSENVNFHIKLFSDSSANAAKEGRAKLTAKDGKSQQYEVLAKHIFKLMVGETYDTTPARYVTSVETQLRRCVSFHLQGTYTHKF